LLSFAGQAFLVGPSLWQGNTTQLSAGLILILSCLCSATGSVITKRFPVNLPGAVMSAYQHLGAGVVFLLVMLIRQVPLPHPSMQAGLALAYLVVFGSVVGFTAFITAIRLLPINIALTHAYVNPVLAMFLGWLLLNEPVTGCTLAGAAMVILGVVCVFRIAPAGEKTKVKAMNRE
jgi:drug/metabolite transporter (DMT)-like permease